MSMSMARITLQFKCPPIPSSDRKTVVALSGWFLLLSKDLLFSSKKVKINGREEDFFSSLGVNEKGVRVRGR